MSKLNPYFVAGYNGAVNPSLFSSDNWLLHEAGHAFERKGYLMPTMAKKSRGYTVKAQTPDNDFMIKFSKDLKTCTIERL